MDTWLSHSRSRFVLGWGVIAKSRVTARSIIEHLNLLNDILFRVVTGRVATMVHELALACPEEALDTGVVPPVASAAPAGDEAVRVEYTLVTRGGIRTAAIRVVQEPCRGCPVRPRHREGLLGQLRGQTCTHRPANHEARVEIKNHGQVTPALGGPDVGAALGPHPVRSLDRELAIEGVLGHRQPVIRLGWWRATPARSWPGSLRRPSTGRRDARRRSVPA